MSIGKFARLILGTAVTLAGVSGTRAPAQCMEEQKLTASDADGMDHFGRSVSASGDTVVVGVELEDCQGQPDSECGAAYVYQFNGSSWVEQKLTAPTRAAHDHFGQSVSVSGNTIIVAARNDSAAVSNCGLAYVFNYNGNSWVEVQTLTCSDANVSDGFGSSVSVSGDEAIIGAPEETGGGLVLRGGLPVPL